MRHQMYVMMVKEHDKMCVMSLECLLHEYFSAEQQTDENLDFCLGRSSTRKTDKVYIS